MSALDQRSTEQTTGNQQATATPAKPGKQPLATGAAPAGAAAKPESIEEVCEKIDHVFAYQSIAQVDAAYLKVNGYAMPTEPAAEQNSMSMRVYLPLAPGKQPILAFRGTVPDGGRQALIDTVFKADGDPRGIGMYQFLPAQKMIEQQLQTASAHGKVIITGWSLGGALAQLTAATFPSYVARIITFQSPGVPTTIANKIKTWNDQHKGSEINSEHFRVEGDAVPSGGQALTPGTVSTYRGGTNGVDYLTQEKQAANQALHGAVVPAAKAAGNAALNAHEAMPLHDHLQLISTQSTDTVNANKSPLPEQIRQAVGTAGVDAYHAEQNVVHGAQQLQQGTINVAHKTAAWAQGLLGSLGNTVTSAEQRMTGTAQTGR